MSLCADRQKHRNGNWKVLVAKCARGALYCRLVFYVVSFNSRRMCGEENALKTTKVTLSRNPHSSILSFSCGRAGSLEAGWFSLRVVLGPGSRSASSLGSASSSFSIPRALTAPAQMRIDLFVRARFSIRFRSVTGAFQRVDFAVACSKRFCNCRILQFQRILL